MKKLLILTLIYFLLKCALKIMPENRSEWIRAMKSETEYLTDDFQALAWALGCLKTATIERLKIMKTKSLRVSKIVLSLEVLCCFIPVSCLFVFFIYKASTLQDLDFNIIIFFSTAITFSMIGPAGIMLGLKFLLRGPSKIGRIFKSTLSVLAMGVVIVPVWYMNLTSGVVGLEDMWLVILLIALMPAMAIFHLIYLSQGKVNLVQQ